MHPGGHNAKYWLHQIGQTKLLSGQHSVQQGTRPMHGHRSRSPRPGPLPSTHSVPCEVCYSLLPSAILCKSNFYGVVTPMSPRGCPALGRTACTALHSPTQASQAPPLHPPSLHLPISPRGTRCAEGESWGSTCFGASELTPTPKSVRVGTAQPQSSFLGCSEGSQRNVHRSTGTLS